jgi:hypothetical protein
MGFKWFYEREGQASAGPFSFAELKALARTGQLQPTDMVWNEGMAQRVPARDILGLFAIAQTVPEDAIQPPGVTRTTEPSTRKCCAPGSTRSRTANATRCRFAGSARS